MASNKLNKSERDTRGRGGYCVVGMRGDGELGCGEGEDVVGSGFFLYYL